MSRKPTANHTTNAWRVAIDSTPLSLVRQNGMHLCVAGYDLMRGDPAERSRAEKQIASVPLPKSDPVYGKEGSVFEHWTED